MDGIQESHQISSKNERNIECRNRQPHSLGCSSVQATDHQTPEADTSCGRPWATWSNIIIRMASTIHGRIDEGIFQFDRRMSSWRGHTTSINSSFRASFSKTYFKKKQEGNTLCSLNFPQTRIAKCADARKFRGCHAKQILATGRAEVVLAKDSGMW